MNKFFIVSFLSIGIILTSCENSEEKENSSPAAGVKFDNEKDEMSYFYGTTRVENLKNAQFYGELNKEMLIKGFKESITIDSNTVKTMNAQISKLIGDKGQDFNASFVDSGSFYLGKFDKYLLTVQLKEFGVKDFFNLKMVENGFSDAIYGKEEISKEKKTELLQVLNEKIGKINSEKLKFENEKDEMSYFYGTTRVENLKNAQFYGELNKEMLIKGFKESISIDSNTVKTMNAQVSKLIGDKGQDFNASFVDSGSFYLGKFDKYMLTVQLKEFGLEDFFNSKMIENGFTDANSYFNYFAKKYYWYVNDFKDPINIKPGFSEGKKTELRQKVSEMIEKVYVEKQMKDGVAFLEKNKKNPKVKVTASGLQYIVLKPGKGPKPNATSRVKVHYHGTTPQGEVFDSSVKRGEPATFGLNQVISGWTEGLQLMSVGSKYKFYVPQELAYGANPQPGSAIKPYMPLVFEVELLAIEK